jgi:hypothetical protein
VFAGLLADSGLTRPRYGLRSSATGRGGPTRSSAAPTSAAEDLNRLSPAVLEMPFDLLRHDMLMTLKPVPWERITSIIDDLFLPLATRMSR